MSAHPKRPFSDSSEPNTQTVPSRPQKRFNPIFPSQPGSQNMNERNSPVRPHMGYQSGGLRSQPDARYENDDLLQQTHHGYEAESDSDSEEEPDVDVEESEDPALMDPLQMTDEELRAFVGRMYSNMLSLKAEVDRLRNGTRPTPPTRTVSVGQQGGGPHKDSLIQSAFLRRIRGRMDISPQDDLPPYEAEPPMHTLGTWPCLRVDWGSEVDTAENRQLIHEAVQHMLTRPGVQDEVRRKGVDHCHRVCMKSLKRLYGRYDLQQGVTTEEYNESTRVGRVQQRSRQRRLDRVAIIRDQPDLSRLYSGALFVISGAMTEDDTDAAGTAGEEDDANIAPASPISPSTSEGQRSHPHRNTGGGSRTGTSRPYAWRSGCYSGFLLEVDSRRPGRPNRRRRINRPSEVTLSRNVKDVPKLPKVLYRWMVCRNFAREFPSLVKHVKDNPPSGPGSHPSLRDPKEWGSPSTLTIHRVP